MPTRCRLLVVAALAAALTALLPTATSVATDAPRRISSGHEPLTAAALVAVLTAEGVAVPDPIDTTAQECPAAGCQQAVVTDTMRVKSFATVTRAEWYAVAHDLPRFANIVVEFAPPLTAAQRNGYLAAIGRLLP